MTLLPLLPPGKRTSVSFDVRWILEVVKGGSVSPSNSLSNAPKESQESFLCPGHETGKKAEKEDQLDVPCPGKAEKKRGKEKGS